MQLRDLYSTIQNQRDQLQTRRQDQAEDFTRRAKTLIAQASAEQFQNKERLKQALDHLMQAIQHQRQYAEAYFCLAYLTHLIGDNQHALVYLKDALEYEPQHALAQELQSEILTQRFAKPQTRVTEAADQMLNEDELQQAIYQAVHHLSSQAQTQTEGLDQQAYLEARQFQQQLQQRLQFFETQLQHLEQDLDLTGLRQALYPLEVFLRRNHLKLKAFQELLSLQREIQREIRVVVKIYEQIANAGSPAAFQALEQKLEQGLDQADRLADQLDSLEAQGVAQQQLVRDYEQLVAISQQVMDSLDEKRPQLSMDSKGT